MHTAMNRQGALVVLMAAAAERGGGQDGPHPHGIDFDFPDVVNKFWTLPNLRVRPGGW